MKAGKWHETMGQPELICSAHTVINAEIVYTRRQYFSLCFCAHLYFPCSLFLDFMYIRIPLCTHFGLLYCISAGLCQLSLTFQVWL